MFKLKCCLSIIDTVKNITGYGLSSEIIYVFRCCWNPFVRSSHRGAVGAADGPAASIVNVVCNCFKSTLMRINICYKFPTVNLVINITLEYLYQQLSVWNMLIK